MFTIFEFFTISHFHIIKNMRISRISSSAEDQMDEQLQNLPIFRTKFRFSKL